MVTAPADYDEQIKSGRLQEGVVVIPKDFTELLSHGQTIDVALEYDESRNNAQVSIRRAEALLQGFSREIALTHLVARGIAPEVLRVVNVRACVNTATPKQQGAFLLFLIPMFGPDRRYGRQYERCHRYHRRRARTRLT